MNSIDMPTYFSSKNGWKALLFYLVLIALMHSPTIFGGKTLLPGNYLPHNVVDSWPGDYEGRVPKETLSIDMATPAYYEFPINKLVGDQYRAGKMPLWNPYQAAGTPLAAQYSTRVFFPYQIVENIAPVWSWDFFLLGRVLIAGLLTYFFLVGLGLSFPSALLGGIFYMFSGTFTWFLNLEQMANVAMVGPLLLLSMDMLARRGLYRDIAISAISFGLVLLAGQPEVALYVLLLGALWFFFRIYSLKKESFIWALKRIAPAYLIGLMLAGPVIVPFIELWDNAHHIHPTGGDMGTRDPNPIGRAINIVTPTFHETPLDPVFSHHPLGETVNHMGEPHYSKIFPNNGVWDHIGGYSGIVALFCSLAGFLVAMGRKGGGGTGGTNDDLRVALYFFFAAGLFIVLKNHGLMPFLLIGKLPLFDQVWTQRWAGPVWTLSFAISGALGFEAIKRYAASGRTEMKQAEAAPSLILLKGMVVHGVIIFTAYHLAIPTFSALYGLIMGEPLPSMQRFAQTSFLLPTMVVFLLLFVVIMRRGKVRDVMLSARQYAALIILTIVVVCALVFVMSFSGIFGTGPEASGVTLSASLAVISANIFVALICLLWRQVRLSSERRGILYTAPILALGILLLTYFFILVEIFTTPGNLRAAVIGPYFDPVMKGGPAFTVLMLILAFITVMWFLRTGRGLSALIGLAALELWFGIPRSYDASGLYIKLPALCVGLAGIWFLARGSRLVTSVLALVFLVLFTWMDSSADYGAPGRHDTFKKTPYVDFIQNEKGFYRTMGLYGALFPNYASAVGLFDVHLINSLAIEAYQAYRVQNLHLDELVPDSSSSLWFTGRPELHVEGEEWKDTVPEEDFERLTPYYSLLGVKYLVVPKGRDLESDSLRLIYDKEVKLYENTTVLPRAFIAHMARGFTDREVIWEAIGDRSYDPLKVVMYEGDAPVGGGLSGSGEGRDTYSKVEITSYEADRVVIDATSAAPGLLVLTDAWYPGWRAYVDGAEVEIRRAYGLFRAVYMDKGRHEVTFSYRPRSFTIGFFSFLAGTALCAFLWFVGRREDLYKQEAHS